MYRGSCLCGAVSFRLTSEPKAVSHCHCRMCQKQHGAAFATYASVHRMDLDYLSEPVQSLLRVGPAVLKTGSDCSFTARKLRILAGFCLA